MYKYIMPNHDYYLCMQALISSTCISFSRFVCFGLVCLGVFWGFFIGGGGLGGLFQMSEIDIHVCALIIPTDLSELF